MTTTQTPLITVNPQLLESGERVVREAIADIGGKIVPAAEAFGARTADTVQRIGEEVKNVGEKAVATGKYAVKKAKNVIGTYIFIIVTIVFVFATIVILTALEYELNSWAIIGTLALVAVVYLLFNNLGVCIVMMLASILLLFRKSSERKHCMSRSDESHGSIERVGSE